MALMLVVGAGPTTKGHGEVVIERRDLPHTVEVRVAPDGSWVREDGLEGALDEVERAALSRIVARLSGPTKLGHRPLEETWGCPGHEVVVRAGGRVYELVEGCGSYPSMSLERLMHFVRRQAWVAARGPLPLVSLRSGELAGGGAEPTSSWLVVFEDGRWVSRDARGEARGVLGERALTRVVELARAARQPMFAGSTCDALPSRWTELRVGGRVHFWRSPCEADPGPAVDQLLRGVREAVDASVGGVAPERPGRFMLALRTGPVSAATNRGELRDVLVVMPDGSWTHEGRTGRLAPAALQDLRERLARTVIGLEPVLPTQARCMAIATRVTEVEVGDGRSAMWDSPCGDEPHPSLVELLGFVATLTKAP